MDLKKTGNFISSVRKALGMTQKELAGRLQVSDRAVSKWERGAGFPDVSILTQLADELGVSEQVHLLGYRRDVPELNYAADVFCAAAS